MTDRLQTELVEYSDSRLDDVRALIAESCRDLLPVEVARTALARYIHSEDFDALAWQEAGRFFEFGTHDECWWIRRKAALPAATDGRVLGLRLDVGFQTGVGHGAILYLDGREYESFTPKMPHLFGGHEISILPKEFAARKEAEFLLKFYAGRDHGPIGKARPRLLEAFELVWFDPTAAKLFYTGMAVRRLLRTLEAGSGTHQELAELLKASLARIDFSTGAASARATLARGLEHLEKGLKKLSQDTPDLVTLVGVGHAHIDTAWTWPYAVSREKSAQTFTTALGLIDRYPEYVFQQGQPQLYQFVKEDAPQLLERIREAVGKGQWDADGAMWVEPDCNVPSGEALVRQLVYGRRFFREELGVESRVLWLVDTFGFPWTLPQIARGCNIDFFVTTKISWNRYNRFPYSFFEWAGPDGTTIPTYFMTVPWMADAAIATYNGVPDPVDIHLGWQRRFPKEPRRALLNALGWGDGGGGVTFEMIEWMRALDKLGGRIDGRWQRVGEFLHEQYEICKSQLPQWRDELFLEFHRGTLTTHAELKKLNRRAEFALCRAETMALLADAGDYPAQEFRLLWQKVLLNQFHDVMAGSSAHDVFEDAVRIYHEALDGAAELERKAVGKLLGEGGDRLAVFNSLGHSRSGLVEVDLPEGKALAGADGAALPLQRLNDRTAVVDAGELPPVGYRTLQIVKGCDTGAVERAVEVGNCTIENDCLRVAINRVTGYLDSVVDKTTGREVLAGPGNELQLFEDKPFVKEHSGWEIDRIFVEKPYKGRIELAEIRPFGGPLRAGYTVEWKAMNSRVRQEIYLDRDCPVVYFKTWVDWREHETLLKAAFPATVNQTQACFEIQYGHIHRPTHRNTSWDIAKFEVPCHKWMDMSEGDYGVSVLNDSKFGCDAIGNTMRLTLLRAPINPDPQADRGFHEFTYALYPHAGRWNQAKTVRYARELNISPIVAACGRTAPAEKSFLRLEPENLVLEVFKGAEDSQAAVVRFYESANVRGRGRLSFDLPFAVRRASLCDMEENSLQELTIENGVVAFDYLPCRIMTIKLEA